MEFVVRRLVPDDQAQLRALRLRALIGEPTAYGSTVEQAMAIPESEWRNRLRPDGNPHFGGFDPGGALVGMAAGLIDVDDPQVADLVSMWVDPPARGTGLAPALVGAVLTWAGARGCRTVRLDVTDGNQRAESLYRNMGFIRTGRSTVRDRDGMAEVEMEAPCGVRS